MVPKDEMVHLEPMDKGEMKDLLVLLDPLENLVVLDLLGPPDLPDRMVDREILYVYKFD